MTNRDILIDGAARLGVGLPEVAADGFMLYLSELARWNAKINLTSVEGTRDTIIKHFLDSMLVCRALPAGKFAAADIGAGAGFPGLPVKLARPDMELVLVEPARKKAVFLRQMVRLLGLPGVEVSEARVEEFAAANPGRFDVVLSRAFRDPERLLPLVGPLLAPGGMVAMSLGPGATPAPEGWTARQSEPVTLPFSDLTRVVAVFRKA